MIIDKSTKHNNSTDETLQNPLQNASHNPQKWVRNPFWQAQNATHKKFGLNSIIDSNANHNILQHTAHSTLGVGRP